MSGAPRPDGMWCSTHLAIGLRILMSDRSGFTRTIIAREGRHLLHIHRGVAPAAAISHWNAFEVSDQSPEACSHNVAGKGRSTYLPSAHMGHRPQAPVRRELSNVLLVLIAGCSVAHNQTDTVLEYRVSTDRGEVAEVKGSPHWAIVAEIFGVA